MTGAKTTQVVLQATSFCNIDCSYCYLPDRSRRNVMPAEVITRTFLFLRDSGIADRALDVRWHAGEPLAVGTDFYFSACDQADRVMGQSYSLNYSIQTNGTMLNKAWCRLFASRDFRVGVSIDGPREIHDAYRVTRHGRGTFERTLQGIDVLRENLIAFDTISVVTSTTLRYRDAFLEFFSDLRPRSLGINVEETEGAHRSSAFGAPDFMHDFRQFVRRLVEWEHETGVPVRECARIRSLIFGNRPMYRDTQNLPFAVMTIDARGNIYTFSPELAGLHHSRYSTFSIGNVLRDRIDDIASNPTFLALRADIQSGVEICRKTCPYFCLCGGGAPANKLYENGSFETAETRMCRAIVKDFADAVVEKIESLQGEALA